MFHNNQDKNLFLKKNIIQKNCFLIPGSGIKIKKKIQKLKKEILLFLHLLEIISP